MGNSKHPSIIHQALHDAQKKKGQEGSASMLLTLVLLVATIASVFVITTTETDPIRIPTQQLSRVKNKVFNVFNATGDFKQFESEIEFKEYLENANDSSNMYFGGATRNFVQPEVALMEESLEFDDWGVDSIAKNQAVPTDGAAAGGSADRVSGTNVQVVGIDEPDIVKTDGEDIYFANYSNNYYLPREPVFWEGDIDDSYSVKYINPANIDVIKAWPPADMDLKTSIEEYGNLLLSDDVLVVFADRNIYGYDVSDSAKPEKIWTVKYDDRTWLQAARLYNDEIYLITKNNIPYNNPCPIEPLTFGDTKLVVECTDIYHPVAPVSVDSTFVAMKLDLKTGEVKADVSFVGSSGSSIVYMSKDSLYVTYNHSINMFDFVADFALTKMLDILPTDIISQIKKLQSYDISSNSKMNELEATLEKWQYSLDKDESLRVENEMQNRMEKYYEDNFRKLYKTELVKVDLEDFDIKADGIVPGYPLNQFALDEYEGKLRIATTIGDRWSGFGDDTANDVYVLDNDLSILGSITDLGLTERIYSARFIGDKGYLVTFRQTDPFYILDLSDAKNPKMTGELKIPGYSSYLHPVKDDLILGVGKEGSKVKLSLFDVSDVKNPKEIDKYSLDEYHSEALNNHHAFLMDAENEIFFLPGNKGGYIFDYSKDKLEMVKAVGDNQVKRAIYFNDYLYVIASENITVLDMKSWVEINKYEIAEE